jgi:hypothetical protein
LNNGSDTFHFPIILYKILNFVNCTSFIQFSKGKPAMGTGGAETLENEDNGTFPGLLPLIQEYLRNIEVDADTMCTLSRYFKVRKLVQGMAYMALLMTM